MNLREETLECPLHTCRSILYFTKFLLFSTCSAFLLLPLGAFTLTSVQSMLGSGPKIRPRPYIVIHITTFWLKLLVSSIYDYTVQVKRNFCTQSQQFGVQMIIHSCAVLFASRILIWPSFPCSLVLFTMRPYLDLGICCSYHTACGTMSEVSQRASASTFGGNDDIYKRRWPSLRPLFHNYYEGFMMFVIFTSLLRSCLRFRICQAYSFAGRSLKYHPELSGTKHVNIKVPLRCA